jgi:tetratricopeptide (TPR) repeat protein
MTSMVLAAACLALMISGCSDANAAKQRSLANGDKLAAEGQLGKAIAEYRNALRRDPRFGEARWKLAEAYFTQGNTTAAFREYMRAADLLPDDVKVQLKAATFLLAAKRFEDARTRADNALKKEPKNVEALIVRATAMAGLKDIPGAIQEIEEAIRTGANDGRVVATLGALRAVDGQDADAEATFKQAVQLSPSTVEPRLALASFYWSKGRRPELEQILAEARQIDPKHPNVNRMLASLYMVTGRAKDAEQPLLLLAQSEPNARMLLADYYVQMKQPEKAVPVLRDLASQKSSYANATLRMAEIERIAGRREAADKLLDEVIKKEPRNADARTLQSTWQLRDRNSDGALKAARAAVDADPASATAQFALAQAQAAAGQRDDAIKALNEVLRLNPRVVSAQVMLSRLQLQGGNADAAAKAAADAQKIAPGLPDAELALVRAALAKGDVRQAEPSVKTLVQRYPQYGASHAAQGLLLATKKDYPGARAAFQRALERDPDNIESLNGLLVLDAMSKSLPSAVARIEQRVQKSPTNPSVLMVAARTYTAARETDKAEKTLKNLIELDANNLSAYVMLARTYMAQKRLDDALVQFDAAAKKSPGSAGPATMVAIILQVQNKSAEAQKRYEAIVASNQHAPVAANNLAWLYAESGTKLNEALALAQTAKSQMPDSPEVNDTLGWVYYKQNLPQLAVAPLEESVKKEPANVSYHYHLGLAYAKAGMADKARAALQKALQINPQFDGAEVARKTLADLRG